MKPYEMVAAALKRVAGNRTARDLATQLPFQAAAGGLTYNQMRELGWETEPSALMAIGAGSFFSPKTFTNAWKARHANPDIDILTNMLAASKKPLLTKATFAGVGGGIQGLHYLNNTMGTGQDALRRLAGESKWALGELPDGTKDYLDRETYERFLRDYGLDPHTYVHDSPEGDLYLDKYKQIFKRKDQLAGMSEGLGKSTESLAEAAGSLQDASKSMERGLTDISRSVNRSTSIAERGINKAVDGAGRMGSAMDRAGRLGYQAGGAGLGGLLGYALAKDLESRSKKRRSSVLRTVLMALGGAGLGAAGGHYLAGGEFPWSGGGDPPVPTPSAPTPEFKLPEFKVPDWLKMPTGP